MNSDRIEASKGNILIVDDTPNNLRFLSNLLTEQGYEVRKATSGQMALRSVQAEPPDLILLDIKMPDIDGYDVCTQMKATEATREIPVIFLSALDDVLDKVKAFDVGAVDYITKPFHLQEVLARVQNQLTIRKLSKQLQQQNQQMQQEIQERKKAEEAAAAASKAKTEFLANMNHELRTPLNAILGFTQLMNRDSCLTIEQRQYLGIINGSGKHLLELINDVLELSKIEAGIISLTESSFDLYFLIDSLEELFQIKAEEKNLKLIFVVSSEVPQYIKTDEKKLRSCLINLLVNAIKFTENGSVTLRVRRELLTGKEGNKQQITNYQLHFEVEDTGAGIAPQEIESLFDAFVQTETGRKSAEGTGLGLNITRKFVQLMGGDIRVSSVVGEGTILKLHIPLIEADSSEVITHPVRQVIGLEPDQITYRILVVDDTPESRLLLIKLLEPIGFQVREAENGNEAITLWESWQPHLIFIDTRMPIMDGIEATKQIRLREKSRVVEADFADKITRKQTASINPSSSSSKQAQVSNYPSLNTVIIALTASVFEENREEILLAGSNDFVRKPFTEKVIFEKIAEYLGLRYIYEDLSPSTTARSRHRYPFDKKPDSFFLSKLAAISPTWVAKLNQAANEVNEDLVIQLIEQISENHAILAEALMDLVNDFRLDVIIRLTQSLITNS